MNDRIKELHNLACRIDMEQHPDAIPDGERIQQKFAELIVRECINVSEEHANWLEAQPFDPELEQYEDGIVNGIYKATAAIKQHFGVEE